MENTHTHTHPNKPRVGFLISVLVTSPGLQASNFRCVSPLGEQAPACVLFWGMAVRQLDREVFTCRPPLRRVCALTVGYLCPLDSPVVAISNNFVLWLEMEIISQQRRPLFRSCNLEDILHFEKVQLRICEGSMLRSVVLRSLRLKPCFAGS